MLKKLLAAFSLAQLLAVRNQYASDLRIAAALPQDLFEHPQGLRPGYWPYAISYSLFFRCSSYRTDQGDASPEFFHDSARCLFDMTSIMH